MVPGKRRVAFLGTPGLEERFGVRFSNSTVDPFPDSGLGQENGRQGNMTEFPETVDNLARRNARCVLLVDAEEVFNLRAEVPDTGRHLRHQILVVRH